MGRLKNYWFILLFVLVCFLVNLLRQNSLIPALLNSLIFSLSLFVYILKFDGKTILFKKPLYSTALLMIAAMPLLSFNPENLFLNILPILILGFLIFYDKLGKLKYFLWPILFLVIIFGQLYLIRIIEFPGGFPKLELNNYIFDSQLIPPLEKDIKQLRGELRLPFAREVWFYSIPVLYPYYYLTNLGKYLEVSHFYNPLLIVNFYLLVLGIYEFFKEKYLYKIFFLSWFCFSILTIGLHVLPDQNKSLFLLSPLFIILMLLGLKRFNKRIYLILLIISLGLIFFKPNI